MRTLVVILAASAGTYALRSVMLVALARREVPARLAARLALVGPAALAALVASSMAGAVASSDGSGLPELAAAAVAFAVVRRTGRVVHAFVAGFPCLWLLTALAA